MRVEASDGSFYFLKDAPGEPSKSLESADTIDCALHFAYGIVYFRVQVPEEKEDMTEAALSKAADAVRAIVSGEMRRDGYVLPPDGGLNGAAVCF